MLKSISLTRYVALAIWVIGIIGLLYWVEQSSFELIFTFGVCAFAGYYVLAFSKHTFSVQQLIWVGILARIIAVFAFPALSDDIYRFIWDGRLALAGIHPFAELPSYYMDSGNQIPGLDLELYEKLNSKEYYSIYPPISQAVFYLSAYLFPKSIYGFAIILKSILAMVDIGSIILFGKILNRLQIAASKVLIYALNPLVIVEISGNAHFEGIMIFFVLLAIYLLSKRKWLISSLAFSGAVASKLIPLIFLPFILFIEKWRDAVKYFVFVGIGMLLLALPMLSGLVLNNFGASVNLYFQKFEFNASIFYVIRWIGFQTKGWDIIQSAGPILAIIVFVAIWIIAIWNRKASIRDWPRLSMWALTIYFSMATIVHPWYITTLVALCVLTNYRFPVLWSGLIMLTYINYSFTPFEEHLGIVFIEYALVYGMLIFEIKKINFTKSLKLSSNEDRS